MTKLSTFIREHTEDILANWETFARALPVSATMDIIALRDHAAQMLDVIAKDLDTPQTDQEGVAKSEGKADAEAHDDVTAAQEHGAGRAESGFTVAQMIAEFRALRASVLRLFSKQPGEVTPELLEEVTRFNEAIDQAIAESISRYTGDVERTKERFLAILGHDLVTPLGAISTASKFMLQTKELKEPHLTLVKRIDSSASRMLRLVDDLLDFTRSSLGEGIPVVRMPMDARQLVHDVVSEVAASDPDRAIQTEFTGDLSGNWDRERLAQMLTNLLGNAVQHGSRESPIRLKARGENGEIVISIHNDGPVISADDMPKIFQPMKPLSPSGKASRHLGLGLYIVDKIVRGHGGSISVESSKEHGTTFTVTLPRDATQDRRSGDAIDAPRPTEEPQLALSAPGSHNIH